MSQEMAKPVLTETHLEDVACNLCGSPRRVLWRERLDERVGYRFRNMRCLDCDLVYVSPRLRPEWRQVFNSWEVVAGRCSEYDAESAFHLFTARHRLERLERHVGGPGTLLDVGCATGYFLHAAQRRGWRAEGVEIDAKAAAQARSRFGLSVTVGTLREAGFPDQAFDCVHMNDVIEHVPDPRATLREAHRILRPGGVLFVGTHNLAGLGARLAGAAWGDLGDLDHLFCFSPRTLRQMLTQSGFTILQMASGEHPGPLARVLGAEATYRIIEESRLARLLCRCADAVRTTSRLGAEIQFYGARA